MMEEGNTQSIVPPSTEGEISLDTDRLNMLTMATVGTFDIESYIPIYCREKLPSGYIGNIPLIRSRDGFMERIDGLDALKAPKTVHLKFFQSTVERFLLLFGLFEQYLFKSADCMPIIYGLFYMIAQYSSKDEKLCSVLIEASYMVPRLHSLKSAAWSDLHSIIYGTFLAFSFDTVVMFVEIIMAYSGGSQLWKVSGLTHVTKGPISHILDKYKTASMKMNRQIDLNLLRHYEERDRKSVQVLSKLDTPKALPFYRDLSSQKSEFRLLCIHNEGNDYSQLECTLEYMPLSKPPPYVALSYCWGKQENPAKIIVNGVEVSVSANLYAALLRLRTEGSLLVWADALCINQRDYEERSIQVRRMFAIFTKAEAVAVWLGSDDGVDNASLETICAKTDFDTSLREHPAFKSLVERAYWERVWVIQELAVASSIIVFCGRYRIPWDLFVETSMTQVGDANKAVSRVRALCRLRDKTQAQKPVAFLDALYVSRAALSTDPRDKLYALLGLVFDGGSYIAEPNYMNSTAEVYVEFATALIRRGLPLDLIHLKSTQRQVIDNLPSWVPDWTDISDEASRRVWDSINYAGKLITRLSRPQDIHITTSELKTQGTVYGTVVEIGNVFSPTEDREFLNLIEVDDTDSFQPSLLGGDIEGLCLILAVRHLHKVAFFCKSQAKIPQNYWDAYTAWNNDNKTVLTKRHIMPECIQGMGDFFGSPGSSASFSECAVRLFLDVAKSGLRFLATDRNTFGWAHPKAQRGDVLMKLSGCSQLSVLRPWHDGYRVVGAVFHPSFNLAGIPIEPERVTLTIF